jgi:hypothetical protein
MVAMTSESVGREFKVGVKPGFEGSMTAMDAWKPIGTDEDVDDRDWSKWRYRRTVPSARPTERKERVEVNARVVTYTWW